MKPLSLAGIVLVVLGALALAYQGFTYTHREEVPGVWGRIRAHERHAGDGSRSAESGGLALVGGIVLLVDRQQAGSVRGNCGRGKSLRRNSDHGGQR